MKAEAAQQVRDDTEEAPQRPAEVSATSYNRQEDRRRLPRCFSERLYSICRMAPAGVLDVRGAGVGDEHIGTLQEAFAHKGAYSA